ncbi:uncharacterized protein LOC120150166 [Hibiscus syriacus]|uniref:uncharacterized protein LOC120150166 n=1 Tax=Hibiscus syriacus TaxID=106335 RepID=UPI001924D3C4|nr:uncharacterized protein LOC120150166 [Hibiscus syriacus]
MMVKDEWVQAAINDDNVVVELLVRLKQAQAAPSAPKSALPALKWGIRHRRSRPMLLRCYAKRDGGSPTTPFVGVVVAATPLLPPPTSLKRPVLISSSHLLSRLPDPRAVLLVKLTEQVPSAQEEIRHLLDWRRRIIFF